MRATLRRSWSRKVAQLRNRSFLDAAMAAAALVSSADDDVRLSEQLALDALLERIDKLQVFEPQTSVDIHRDFVERFAADPDLGRKNALDRIAAFRGDDSDRLLILYVGAVIARADLELSDAEERVLADICTALGLSPAESMARLWESGESDG